MSFQTNAPEAKSFEAKSFEAKSSADIALAFEDFSRTFEAFQRTNDERLGEIEQRLSSDVVTEEKLARIDAALDESKRRLDRVQIDAQRPALGGHPGANRAELADPAASEHKTAFDLYVRAGEASGLKTLEERALDTKALSAGSGPDGGYLVPNPLEADVLRRLANISPIRSIATVRTIAGGQYKQAVSIAGPTTGWVGETSARPQTSGPTLAQVAFPAMELYAMPAATQTLLDDAVLDVDSWLASEVETAFAEQEGAAFVGGDGVNKPQGFLQVPTVAEASWSWGNLSTISTGNVGAFAASGPSDILVDLVYALKAGYRQNASFVMNRRTQSAVRKFKDANGNYIWQPPASAGAPATLMGFPVVEAEDMPTIGANSLSIAFGDFKRGYLVVDRAGIRVLRDPYSAKPFILFYTTKRVGGGVQDYAAIKLLKFAA